METKILGIILAILGISGLIAALLYVNAAGNSTQVGLLFACGIAAAVAFFAGIRLIPSSRAYNKTADANYDRSSE
jgi:hypothetical protein